jgi:hypothetical protein
MLVFLFVAKPFMRFAHCHPARRPHNIFQTNPFVQLTCRVRSLIYDIEINKTPILKYKYPHRN